MPTYFSRRTGQWGSPRKRLTVLATDKGHDTKVLRHQDLHRGVPGTETEAFLTMATTHIWIDRLVVQ